MVSPLVHPLKMGHKGMALLAAMRISSVLIIWDKSFEPPGNGGSKGGIQQSGRSPLQVHGICGQFNY